MEKKAVRISGVTTSFVTTPPRGIKPQLMTYRPRTTRIIIIGFMILVGACLAQSIYNQNILGVILAIISLVAGIYFIHLFNQAQAEIEEAEWRERQK